jgi:hypothetical protein
MLSVPALVCEVIALPADMALLRVVLWVLPTLKFVVPRIGTLGTILLLSRIIILTAVVTPFHGGVNFPQVP